MELTMETVWVVRVERKSEREAIYYHLFRTPEAAEAFIRIVVPPSHISSFFQRWEPQVALLQDEGHDYLFYTNNGFDGRVECQRVILPVQ